MALGKHISRVIAFILALGVLFYILIGGAARGTALPIIESVGPPPPHTDGHTLRIATANLWGVSVLGLDWSDNIDERFAAMAERLSANGPLLDVVLIQEAWKNVARRALLAHEGVKRKFPYRVDIAEQPGGAGLVILSRLPIEKAHFHRFRAQGQCLKIWEGDCISGKGIVAVQLKLGDHSVWVGNTHLIACYTRPRESETLCDVQDPNGSYRWNQIVEARQAIESLVGEDPAIFGGDFNFTRTSRYYPAMTSRMIPSEPTDTPPQLHATGSGRGWTAVNAAIVNANRLGYFWTRPGKKFRWHAREKLHSIFTRPVALRSGKSVPLSDHTVFMATLCLVHADDPGNRCLSYDNESETEIRVN